MAKYDIISGRDAIFQVIYTNLWTVKLRFPCYPEFRLNQRFYNVREGYLFMRRVLTSFKRDKWLYVMVAPALLWFLIFCYTPMFGIGIAFRRYQPGMSFFSFDGFVGFKNFQNLFSDHFFWRAFQNSIILAVMRIAVCLPAAVFMAILLSEVKNKVFKSLVQTVTYIPHFLSWVVVSVFCITFFNPETGINFLLKGRGLSPITLTDNNLFRIIVVGADMWKDMGFNSVLFLSAILSIDPGLSESAAIDGAGRGRCIFSITLPCIRNTILTVFVLWVGTIIGAGFDQIFNMYNPAVYATGDIIDTYVYRTAFSMGGDNYGTATAAGLFKSVISLGLLLGANAFSRRIGEEIIF